MPKTPNVHIDDDPELSRLATDSNKELMKEIEESPEATDGLPPEETKTALPNSSDSDGLDLGEDLARLDEQAGLGEVTEIEEFAAEELQIKPAETLAEFRDAIAQAQVNGLRSIQASKKVIWHFVKPHYPPRGFFHYHGVRVDEIGKTEEIEKSLNLTTEEMIFGRRK